LAVVSGETPLPGAPRGGEGRILSSILPGPGTSSQMRGSSAPNVAIEHHFSNYRSRASKGLTNDFPGVATELSEMCMFCNKEVAIQLTFIVDSRHSMANFVQGLELIKI
jgi:hypothetical protein